MTSKSCLPHRKFTEKGLHNHFYEDAYHNLTRVVDPLGNQTSYTYDLNGNVLTATDANLRVMTSTYDEKNRLKTRTDPLGHVTSYGYDANGNLTSMTDANGNETQYTYTPTNRLASTIDALGHVTSYGYDESGNRTSMTDANGNTTGYQYDDAGQLVTVVLPDGNTITQAYDGLGRVVATTTPNGNQPAVSAINLVNAFNWLQNPSIDGVSPYDATQPTNWAPTPTGPSNVRDTTVSHSSDASLELALTTGRQLWAQPSLPFPQGATGLFGFWARGDGSTTSAGVWPEIMYFAATGLAETLFGSPMNLPTGSTAWQEYPLYRFAVPSPSLFLTSVLQQVSLVGQSTAASTAWYDDAVMYLLSNATAYTQEGQTQSTIGPDGALARYAYDRFGRQVAMTDPKGNVTTKTYDSLGRVLSVTDPNGNTSSFTYDAVGNLQSSTDPNGNATRYGYDANNRLTSITYPDSSTELFTYDPVGNLQSHTNNRNQQKVFVYDAANRLVYTRYQTDGTDVSRAYDGVGNLLKMVERNFDFIDYTYDAINRLIEEERVPHQSGGAAWIQRHVYDDVGNRLQFCSGASGPDYDAAHYDVDSCADAEPVWSVPSPGYDSRNRMPAFIDALGQKTAIAYDVESRPTALDYPNGATTSMGYDVVGKPMSVSTSEGATSLLPVGYGYDLAGNRIAVSPGENNFDYAVDNGNRLVEENQDVFSEQTFSRFQTGAVSLCAVDASTGTVGLLPFADSLSGASIEADRWRLVCTNPSPVGFEIRPLAGSLQMAFPKGYCNNIGNSDLMTNAYGLNASLVAGAAEHRQQLAGDFDVAVNYLDYEGKNGFGTVVAGLYVSDTPFEQMGGPTSTCALILRANIPAYNALVVVGGTTQVNSDSGATTDTSGQLRIARTGSAINLYWWDAGSSSWVLQGTWATYSTSPCYVGLVLQIQNSVGSAAFNNFAALSGVAAYPASGTYTSAVYDAGQSVSWASVTCTVDLPAPTSVALQAAVSDSVSGPWSYVGPDGTAGTYFTTFPATLPPLSGRYCRYQATLSGPGSATPTLRQVLLTYGGADTSLVRSYAFDAAGNMRQLEVAGLGGAITSEVRDDASWPSGERINNLNQILRNDVTDALGTTTWRYTYDLSGNLTGKTDGVNTWSYLWDENNRLVQATLPGGAIVGYTYDEMGRMLTRTASGATTVFEWDGFDCVRESGPAAGTAPYDVAHYDTTATYGTSGETQYCVVGGKLYELVRDGIPYAVVSDAMGHVRLVLDPAGATVSRFDYDAWGNVLPSSFDNLPSGMPYRYVGAPGVRWDADLGMYYMRHRWYDATLRRFIGRDSVNGANRYSYVANEPALSVDPNGTAPVLPGYPPPSKASYGYPIVGDTIGILLGIGGELAFSLGATVIGAGILFVGTAVTIYGFRSTGQAMALQARYTAYTHIAEVMGSKVLMPTTEQMQAAGITYGDLFNLGIIHSMPGAAQPGSIVNTVDPPVVAVYAKGNPGFKPDPGSMRSDPHFIIYVNGGEYYSATGWTKCTYTATDADGVPHTWPAMWPSPPSSEP